MKTTSWITMTATGCLALAGLEARESHHFHSLGFHEGRPKVALSWASGTTGEGPQLEVFFAPSLTGRWQRVEIFNPSAGVTNWEVELSAQLAVLNSGFFKAVEVVDSDGDGVSDAREELEFGSNPFSLDSDQDTIPDEYEVAHGMDPTDPDSEHDGVPDEFELMHGSNPLLADTDGDGLSDCEEWLIYYTDMTCADTDHDGLNDGEEVAAGADPFNDYSLDSRYADRFSVLLGGMDPEAYPAGSTNQIWEHIFYTGDDNFPFSYPVSDDNRAVLKLKVQGSGAAEVNIGRSYYLLFLAGGPTSSRTVLVSVAKGECQDILINGEGLSFDLDSEDFMIGERPQISDYQRQSGWVMFPNTVASIPCIHSEKEQSLKLTLSPGTGVTGFEATWEPAAGVEVENDPPLSAVVSGKFSAGVLEAVEYTLSHPSYISGNCRFHQRAEYCQLSIDEERREEDPDYDQDDDGNPSYLNESTEYDYIEQLREEEVLASETNDFEKISEFAPLENVLKLHDPEEAMEIFLQVDTSCPACCRCPDHFAGAVRLESISSRLRLYTEAGEDFNYTGEDETVYVKGVIPSEYVGDAPLSFRRAGKIYESRRFTVLGVGIDSSDFDLAAWNKLSNNAGLPLAVSKGGEVVGDWLVGALPGGAYLNLRYWVGLKSGRVLLSLKNTTGHFKIWAYNQSVSSWQRILDSAERPFVNMSVSEWRSYLCDDSVQILVSADEVGETTLEYSYAHASGGKMASDKAVQHLAAGKPKLVMDYDRDGVIDADDMRIAERGERVFRFWINDDADECEGQGGLDDLPGSGSNAADGVVNGPRDLVDLVPIYVDLRSAYPTNFPEFIKNRMVWKLKSSCLRVMETDLDCENAGAYQTRDCGETFGSLADKSIYAAPMNSAVEGYEFHFDFTKKARAENGKGILLAEGMAAGTDLALEGCVALGDQSVRLFEYPVKLQVTPVSEMYRWISLRESTIDDSGPPANHDEDCLPNDNRELVFVHGFNVNESEARAWAAELFKRFYQAGFDDDFIAVDWAGDSSQFHSVLKDDNYAPDYYVNVQHAFTAASRLTEALENLSGKIDIIGHSLGNMVVSAAIADYGLKYNCYYMLNAAVPMEAYDESAYAAAMVDTEWSKVPDKYWASNWSGLFGSWDFRHSLSWRGRFADLRNVVNCYSETEDVLGNPRTGQVTFSGGAWKIQELSKGTTTWYDLNAASLGNLEVVCEGGWGINPLYGINPLWYVYQVGFTSRAQQELTREVAITDPLFTPFKVRQVELQGVEDMILNESEELRARLLGDAIPATSFAQGANSAPELPTWRNWSLPALADHEETWPRGQSEAGVCTWRHSDVKDLSYFYVHRWYEKIVKGE